MQKIISTTIALLMMACLVQAERVNAGGYFSIYIPDYWKVNLSGETTNKPGNYSIYQAQTINSKAPKIWVSINVFNSQAPGMLNFDTWNKCTQADLGAIAKNNWETGYNYPTVRRTTVNGIPAFIFNTQNEKEKWNLLEIFLFINGKEFKVTFIYYKDGTKTVDNVLESLRIEAGGLILLPSEYTLVEPTPSPTPTPTPQAEIPSTESKDCLLTATETYARIKPSAYWTRILGFSFTKEDKKYYHAIVLYQPTTTSNIFFYEKTVGSIKLYTQSHDLIKIGNAIQECFKDGIMVQDPQWLD